MGERAKLSLAAKPLESSSHVLSGPKRIAEGHEWIDADNVSRFSAARLRFTEAKRPDVKS
jgi:hypothetical protein